MKIGMQKTVRVIKWGGTALFSFALSCAGVGRGVYPFGQALLCGCDGNAFAVFAGVFASGFLYGNAGLLRSVLAMAIYGMRWLFRRRARGIPLWAKLTAAAVSTGCIAAYEFTERNALFETAAVAVCAFSVTPLMTLLFAFGKSTGIRRDLYTLAAVYSAVRALGVLSGFAGIGYIVPELAVGVFLTLYFARTNAFFGGMCGLAAGMAAGAVYVPVLAVAGLSYGIFFEGAADKKWMRVFAALFSAALSVSSGLYLASISGAFPEMLWVAAGYVCFVLVSPKLPKPEARPVVRRDKATTLTLKKMSAAFSSLAEAFYTDNTAPDKADIAAGLRKQLFACCNKCAECGKCGIDKYDYANHLTEIASGTENELPVHIKAACVMKKRMVAAAMAVRGARAAESEKEARLLTEGYGSIARLLDTAGESAEQENAVNRALTKKAAEAFSALGIKCSAICVRGSRKATLRASVSAMSDITVTSEALRAAVSAALGMSLSLPEFHPREGYTEITMSALPVIRLEYAKAEASKPGEAVSGDTAVTFENDSQMFYSLLADGMGSGREASVSSRLAALFLEKLISAGGDKKEALFMLNSLLLVRKSEVYTTVDLLEIDRLSGEASLIKAGAAPTYICRGEKCYKLESGSPPAGVVDDLKVSQTKLKVHRGDWVIMISDGMLTSAGELVLPKVKKTASAYAAAIMEERRESGTVCRDDMSVCVIKVC